MGIIHEIGKFVPDSLYLRRQYKKIMGKPLNLKNPQTFNEKLQWLKIHDRKPVYTTMVDKYATKEYVANIIGEEYIIPTLGVWNSFDEIDFDNLPEQFVLKCNHDSGSTVVCKDKSKLDKVAAKAKLEKCLQRNYFYNGREWPYKNIKPVIFAEAYIEDSNSHDLWDYKFFCFDGYVDNVMMVTDRYTDNTKFYHFSREWKICHYNRLGRTLPDDFTLPKPQNIEEMFRIAEILSKGIPEVRIDLYDVNGHIYFGEYTFFHESGFETGFDYQSDKHLGDLINLPNKML